MDLSDAKQYAAEIFNIVVTKGKKGTSMGMPEYTLGKITVNDARSFRTLNMPQGSVTETKANGYMRFVEVDAAQLKTIADCLKAAP